MSVRGRESYFIQTNKEIKRLTAVSSRISIRKRDAQEIALLLPKGTRARDQARAEDGEERLVRELNILGVVALVRIEHAAEERGVCDDDTGLHCMCVCVCVCV